MNRSFVVLGIALALGLTGVGCGGAERYRAEGVVEDLQADYGTHGQVVVAHDDIPGLMPAMTMNFDLASPALLEGLAPGQRIRFELEYDRRSYRITGIEVLEGGVGDGSAGARLEASRQRFANLAKASGPAPSFALTDQQGRPLSDTDLLGKVLLVDFIYTRCPGPCPILTGTHVSTWRAIPEPLRKHVHFVSISLDPLNDTPEALTAYARDRGAAVPGWSFLTGSPEDVDAVLAGYGIGRTARPDGEIDHLVVTFLIDAEGRIVRRFVGMEYAAATIAAEIVDLVRARPAG